MNYSTSFLRKKGDPTEISFCILYNLLITGAIMTILGRILIFAGVILGIMGGLYLDDAWAQEDTRAGRLKQQRLEKAEKLEEYQPNAAENSFLFIQERKIFEKFADGFKGFHPILGGMSTGSGFAAGVLWAPLKDEDEFHVSIAASGSLKAYQNYNTSFGYERGPFMTYTFARYRNYPQEAFYGLGMDSTLEDETNYRLEDTIAGGLAGIKPHEYLTFTVYYAYLHTHIGSGTGDDPSIEDIFDEEDLPGLATQPDYNILAFRASLDTRNVYLSKDYGSRYAPTFAALGKRTANPNRGTLIWFSAERYLDHDKGLFDFNRYELEFQQYFPFNHGHHVLALRHYTSINTAGSGAEVPFFMMRSLGGKNTLRGYHEFRFTDRNGLLFNAEYRWQAWIGLDMALFFDAGKMFEHARDWDLNDLEVSYGIGWRFNTYKSVLFRTDIAHSKEGTRFFFDFGHVF
ncbi:BamA/TamA family outer membrane protein [Acidobacteriota bacterium]